MKRKLRILVKRHCKNLEIKVLFSSFKNLKLNEYKDPATQSPCSNVIYKFNCAGCKSVYIGETSRHLFTRVREHLHSDNNSHIFKHPKGFDKCGKFCIDKCFTVLDTARTYNQLKIKEALHILWEKPILNTSILLQASSPLLLFSLYNFCHYFIEYIYIYVF